MKPKEISNMFSRIARRYDFVNHVISGGLDVSWRRRVVRLAESKNGSKILDVACGTGDLAIEFAKTNRNIEITGIDFSERMLSMAKEKIKNKGLHGIIALQYADALALPFKDACFDVVGTAFGIRNMENRIKCIEEMKRVVKKDGKVIVLEVSKPTGFIKPFYGMHIRYIIPVLGGMILQYRAYMYLYSSIKEFTNNVNIGEIMKEKGLRDIRQISLTFGAVSIYIGIK